MEMDSNADCHKHILAAIPSKPKESTKVAAEPGANPGTDRSRLNTGAMIVMIMVDPR